MIGSILEVKRATQSLRLGATGMGNNFGFWSKKRLRSQVEAKMGETWNMLIEKCYNIPQLSSNNPDLYNDLDACAALITHATEASTSLVTRRTDLEDVLVKLKRVPSNLVGVALCAKPVHSCSVPLPACLSSLEIKLL